MQKQNNDIFLLKFSFIYDAFLYSLQHILDIFCKVILLLKKREKDVKNLYLQKYYIFI